MTLGNNQQPLTRRQARELARQQEAAEAAGGAAAASVSAAVSAQSQLPSLLPHSAAPVIPVVRDAPTEAETTAERALSRREMRSRMVARPLPPVDDREDDGIDDAVEADALEMVEVETDTGVDVRSAVRAGGKLNPPVGHWSVPRDVDEDVTSTGEFRPLDQTLGRGVSAGGVPTTTNALILPSLPQPAGTGALGNTGDVLVTGSIDLPRSLGSTGQHPNTFDSADVDHMLDQLDEGAPTSDVAPVSASRAVSTHTSTRGVMTAPKKRGITLPTVLAITAAVLAVGVAALLVAGLVFNVF